MKNINDMTDKDWQKELVRGVGNCFACGKRIEQTADGYANHHCRETHEAAKRSANTRAEDGYSRTPPWPERLADGLRMLDAIEDYDGEIDN